MIKFAELKGNKILKSIVIYLNVIVISLGLILSSALYLNYEKLSTNMVQSYTIEGLSQISYSTNFMLDTAKNTLMQYYSNPSVSKLMNTSDFDYLELGELLAQVKNINIETPFISSIYIYNRASSRVYCNLSEYDINSFPDKDIVKRLNSNNIKIMYPIPRRIPSVKYFENKSQSLTDSKILEDVYTFVLYENHSGPINSAIVLNVSQQWMKDTMKSMNKEISNETIIIDSKGNVVLNNDVYKDDINILNRGLLSKTLTSKKKQGYDIESLNGKKYLITYVSSDTLDWKYVRITPYENIIGQLKKIRDGTLLIGMIIIAIGIVISIFISGKLYNPVSKIIHDLQKVTNEVDITLYEEKKTFFKDIFNVINEDVDFLDGLLIYNIHLDAKLHFVNILFKIDDYEELCKKYSMKDLDLFAFGIVNMTKDLVQPFKFSETVDMGDGYITLLLNIRYESYDEDLKLLESVVKSIQYNTQRYLKLSLSSVIGEPVEDYLELPNAYGECKYAMNYKVFFGFKCIIYAKNINDIEEKKYRYPVQKITQLIDDLLLGKTNEAIELYNEIIEGTVGFSYSNLQMIVVNLAISIKNALEKIHKDSISLNSSEFYSIINNISNYETFDSINLKFYNLFDNISVAVLEVNRLIKPDEKYDHLIIKVKELVKCQYTNQDLTAITLAYEVKLSPEYLRRIFKKVTDETLGDYINKYRINKSKELLLNTTKSVNEIAASAGFVNVNYFYTIFKKLNGLTAGEFRNLNSNNNDKSL